MSQDVQDSQKARTKEIDGYTYTVGMMEPMAAFDLLQDMLKILAPVSGGAVHMVSNEGVGKLMAAATEAGLDDVPLTNTDGKVFGDAVTRLFSNWDKSVFKRACDEMAKVTLVAPGGKMTPILSAHFQGRLGSMLKWLAFALGTNYRSLFFDSKGNIGAVFLQVVAHLKSRSQTTSAETG